MEQLNRSAKYTTFVQKVNDYERVVRAKQQVEQKQIHVEYMTEHNYENADIFRLRRVSMPYRGKRLKPLSR